MHSISTDSEELNSSAKINRGKRRTKRQCRKRAAIKRSETGDLILVGKNKVPQVQSLELNKRTLAPKNEELHMNKSRSGMSHKRESHKYEKRTRMTVEEGHKLLDEKSLEHLNGEISTSDLELSEESDSSLHFTKATSFPRSSRGQENGLDHLASCAVSTFGSRLGHSHKNLMVPLGAEDHLVSQPGIQDIVRLQGLNMQAGNNFYTSDKTTDLAVMKNKKFYSEDKETMTTMSQEAQEKEQDLQTQVEAMVTMLETCDLVEQLVLRNTGLTDDLLKSLVTALKNSPSEVILINLNLNSIGPPGVQTLLNLMRLKPQIKGL
ncbi:hypothetical protein JZ751_001153, partial [Albula glossodonta]